MHKRLWINCALCCCCCYFYYEQYLYRKFNLRDVVRKMAEKELQQQTYQNTPSIVQQIYNKLNLSYCPVKEKMKMVKFCALWHDTKASTLDSDSEPALVEWANFCKKCSEQIRNSG